MKTESIYALRDGDQWQYVGRSSHPMERAGHHRARGIVFDSVVTLAVVRSRFAPAVETQAILALRPKCNLANDGRGGRAKARRLFPACIAARCSPQEKQRMADAVRSTGVDESEFLRMALELFFERYPTPKDQIAAVYNHRVARMQEGTA